MMDSQYSRRRPLLDQPPNPAYSHSRTRTTSSNIFPAPYQQEQSSNPYAYHQQPHMHLAQPGASHQRRSPSVNTFSTVSSGGMAPPAAYKTSPTTDIRRSTSSRSGGGTPGSPSGGLNYVALLRKQKATVWSDRAQHEDSRPLAQQRAARMRAQLEVVGSNGGLSVGSFGGRTSTGLSSAGGKVAAKIRHHGKPGVIGYAPDSNLAGVGGVPLRLSATEVEGGDSDDDDQKPHHRRTGSSSRSSTASGKRALGYRTSGGLGPSNSLSGGKRWSPGGTPERSGSLVLEENEGEPNYAADDAASATARSFGSGSSGERLDNVPDLSAQGQRLATNSLMHATVTREKSVKSADDLRRRGSVDERTVSLNTTGRLFIANPD